MLIRLRGLAIAILLASCSLANAQDIKPSSPQGNKPSPSQTIKPSTSDARPSMPFSGTAMMLEDGSLTLRLRQTRDGKAIDDTLIYKTTDRGYDSVKRRLGRLAPGETTSFRPWKD
jgi:hypothetical protein